ncbi:MAG: hypothetical protein H8K04_15060 [Nitrospira sp.]
MPTSCFPPRRYLTTSCVALLLVLSVVGCSLLNRGQEPIYSQPIPLTPAIWFSPSGTTAEVPFQNACGESASFPLAQVLKGSVPKRLNEIFTGITTQSLPEETLDSDGVIEVGVGLRRIDLAIPKQAPGTYPATATVGVEMVFLARDGALLFSKKLTGTGRGIVTVGDQSCEIAGVEAIVQEAMDSVAEGLAKQMAQSVQIREYAAQRDTWVPMAARPRPTAVAPTAETAAVPPAAVPEMVEQPSVAPTDVAHPVQLSFRAIIRDENRDQLLGPDEAITIEIEVKNEGLAEAKDVAVTVEGKAEAASLFPPEILIGALQPGEIRRTSLTKRVTVPERAHPFELTLNLRTANPLESVPPPKIFSFGSKPKYAAAVSVPDVDHMPKSLAAFKQPKAVIISIGVGTFRDNQMPEVKYAGHDAAVMAEYLHTIGSVPRERMKILLDRQALQREFEETFERWLRKRADAETVVYVFFAGRALVDGATGAVSLVPFDGTPTEPKQLYPLIRLQESLSRLSIERAILMFDVSLEPSPGANLAAMPSPDWMSSAGDGRKDVEMWMVGNRHLQEAHAFEEGKHGLFTYHLLRGLQGIADVDRDGTIVAGELCTYARGQVARIAREQFGNKQDPLCLPSVGKEAMVRIHPLAKGNNPKPAPTPRQPEPSADSVGPTPNLKPMGP